MFGAVHLEFSVVRGNEHLATILISHYVQIGPLGEDIKVTPSVFRTQTLREH